MANNTWSNYTEKTATPVDADEVMVRDSTDGKNKRLLFGTFWKWVAKKLNEATISELQTSNKTIIGAINALNSDMANSGKRIFSRVQNAGTLSFPIKKYSCMLVILQTSTSSNTPIYIISGYNSDICIQLISGGRTDTKANVENDQLVITLTYSTYVLIYSF